MLTQEHGILDAPPVTPRSVRDAAAGRWLAPGLAVAGSAAGLFAADACSSGLALPASGLALTVAGAMLWLTGMRRERRDPLALAIAVAIALLSIAALQQLLVCMMGRAGMAAAEVLQDGGMALLLVALALELARLFRQQPALAQAAAVLAPEIAPRPSLARIVEATAKTLGRRHGLEVQCDLAPDAEADPATRRALLRLLRSAIADTAYRGDARTVRVELREGPRLSVTDDGRGFRPSPGAFHEPAQAGATAARGAGARNASF